MEGISFGEAFREMAKRVGVRVSGKKRTAADERRDKIVEINRLATDYFHHILSEHQVGEKAREFLKKRGVTKEALQVFDLGYAPSSWDSLGKFVMSKNYTLTDYLSSGLGVKKSQGRGFYDFFRGRIIFPFRSITGRVIGFSARTLGKEEPKYVHTAETPLFAKRYFLYNIDLAKQEIKKEREAILVEGMMDVIALYEKGIKNAVATMGTALTDEQVKILSRFADSVKICFDRDSAGLEATKKGIMIAQSAGLEVRAVLLPSGRDPDEAIRKNEKSFRKALTEAPTVFDFYLQSALERFDGEAATGKKKITAELLPVLKSLANEVEKASYLKKLSETLDVPEDSLWRQMDKEEALEVKEVSPKEVKLSYPKREAYLLSAILSLPPQEARKALHKLSPEDVADPRLEEIFSTLKSYLSRIKRFRLANFSAKLDGDQKRILEELVLLSPSPSGAVSEEELEAMIKVVKEFRYRRELKDLVVEVKAAEKGEKVREVKRLQREILKISDKIKNL
jgi:DNA primase